MTWSAFILRFHDVVCIHSLFQDVVCIHSPIHDVFSIYSPFHDVVCIYSLHLVFVTGVNINTLDSGHVGKQPIKSVHVCIFTTKTNRGFLWEILRLCDILNCTEL